MALARRRTTMSVELACRVSSSATHSRDESITPVPRRHDRANVQQQFERLATTPQGCYALVDYVNFKGEGVLRTERYQGQGWGLLQVLESMHGTSDTTAVDEFSGAAKAILTRRVHNAPAQRHESRWLTGWIQRVNSYSGS